MTRRLAPLFSFVLAVGCGAPTAVAEPFDYGEPFWVTIGRTAISSDGSAAVRFSRVVGDSRCPGGDIVCVWEGEASVEIGVLVPPSAETLIVVGVGPSRNTGPAGPLHGPLVAALALEPFAIGAPAGALPRVQLRVTAVR